VSPDADPAPAPAPDRDADPDVSERRLRRNCWLLVAVLSGLSLFWGLPAAAAVAAGGILSALNVEGLVKLVHLVTARAQEDAAWSTILGVVLRYLLLGVGLFVIVSVWRANVVAFSLGLSVPVAAVLLEWTSFR
jgi:ATP synthase I chain